MGAPAGPGDDKGLEAGAAGPASEAGAVAASPERMDFEISSTTWLIVVLCTVVLVALVVKSAQSDHRHGGSDGYVGPEACGECHPEQHESWDETRMAKAFEVLRAGQAVEEKKVAGLDPQKDYTRDPKCLECHTTAYGLLGGFVSFEQTPHMAGVTCEACHGPGGMYAGDKAMTGHRVQEIAEDETDHQAVVYPPNERVCKKCHNDKSPFVNMEYEFDFEDRMEKGTHQHFKLKYKPKTTTR